MSCANIHLLKIVEEQADIYIRVTKSTELGTVNQVNAICPETQQIKFTVHFWTSPATDPELIVANCVVHPIPDHLDLTPSSILVPSSYKKAENGTSMLMHLTPGKETRNGDAQEHIHVDRFGSMEFNYKTYNDVLAKQFKVFFGYAEEPQLRAFLRTVFEPFKEHADAERSRPDTPRRSIEDDTDLEF